MGINDDVQVPPIDTGRQVRPITGTQRKVTLKVDEVASRQPRGHQQPHSQPEEDEEANREYREKTALLVEAIEKFNDDMRRSGSCYSLRLWDQGGRGFHLQLVCDIDTVVHQTEFITTADINLDNIDKFIDEIIREKGIIIDVQR